MLDFCRGLLCEDYRVFPPPPRLAEALAEPDWDADFDAGDILRLSEGWRYFDQLEKNIKVIIDADMECSISRRPFLRPFLLPDDVERILREFPTDQFTPREIFRSAALIYTCD